MTLAERYNQKAKEIIPWADRLIVDPLLTRACDIEDVVSHRSEYLGGMAVVILELVTRDS
jgi:hypothetical protein